MADFDSGDQGQVDPRASAAILMLLLDEATAAKIIGGLSPREIETLGRTMFEVASSAEDDVEQALSTFVERSRSVPALSVGADIRIRSMIEDAVGIARSQAILATFAPKAAEALMESLSWLDPAALARLVDEEHPQIAAIVISLVPPSDGAKALAMLAPDRQADIVQRAAVLENVPAEALTELEELLRSYGPGGGGSGAGEAGIAGGVDDVAKVVAALPKPGSDKLLQMIRKRDAALARQLEQQMFRFEDLAALDRKALGAVLREVDAAVLALAFKGASKAFTEQAFATLSARAAQSIRDDMAEKGQVKKADVEEAQRTIAAVARRLADEGVINLGQGGEDYV